MPPSTVFDTEENIMKPDVKLPLPRASGDWKTASKPEERSFSKLVPNTAVEYLYHSNHMPREGHAALFCVRAVSRAIPGIRSAHFKAIRLA